MGNRNYDPWMHATHDGRQYVNGDGSMKKINGFIFDR